MSRLLTIMFNTIPAYLLSSADFVWQILRKSSDGEGTAMARNKVQFQKGLTEAEFEELDGTEEKCRAVVMASRWPNGFECPACGGVAHTAGTMRRGFPGRAPPLANSPRPRGPSTVAAPAACARRRPPAPPSPPPLCRWGCGFAPCLTRPRAGGASPGRGWAAAPA